MPPSQLSELGLDEVSGHVHALLEVEGAPLEGVVLVQLQPRPLAQLPHLLLREEVAPGAVLPHVELLGDLGPRLEPNQKYNSFNSSI